MRASAHEHIFSFMQVSFVHLPVHDHRLLDLSFSSLKDPNFLCPLCFDIEDELFSIYVSDLDGA